MNKVISLEYFLSTKAILKNWGQIVVFKYYTNNLLCKWEVKYSVSKNVFLVLNMLAYSDICARVQHTGLSGAAKKPTQVPQFS